ncbi:MAG: hypothetical protein K1W25_02245, partial [Lachnospiraceae bacterium]
IRIVISEFLPERSHFLPETQTFLHYHHNRKGPAKTGPKSLRIPFIPLHFHPEGEVTLPQSVQ